MFLDDKPQGEVTKTLKLSEAIRLGATLRQQCVGKWASEGGSCAVMAAAEATGFPYGHGGDELIKHVMLRFGVSFDVIYDAWKKHDETESREAVADWLEARGY